jgi:deazaflavin-dependent oxidoreductase (nitroreductase family)
MAVSIQIEPYKNHWFYSATKAILTSRPGSWFFSHTLHLFDRIVQGISRERYSFTELLGGVPVITLTTTGAKSGLRRSVPLVGFPDGDQIILIASNFGRAFHPAWYHNLRAKPEVLVTYKGKSAPYRAREAEGKERSLSWKKGLECYPGYEMYRKRAGSRRIPVLRLTPAPGSSGEKPASVETGQITS